MIEFVADNVGYFTEGTPNFFYPFPNVGHTSCLYLMFSPSTSAQAHDEGDIAYIDCNYKRKDDQKIKHCMAGLLIQLAQIRPSLPDDAKRWKVKRRQGDRPTSKNLRLRNNYWRGCP